MRNQMSPQQVQQPQTATRSSSNNRDHSPYNNVPMNALPPRAASNPSYTQPNNSGYYPKNNYQPPQTASQYPQPSQPSYDPSKFRGHEYPQQRQYDHQRLGYDARGGYDQRYYPQQHVSQQQLAQPPQNYYPMNQPSYGNPQTRYPPGFANTYGDMGGYRAE